MRSYNSDDKDDIECIKDLNAEQWQIDLLKLNPSYSCWGPYEDYMIAPSKEEQEKRFKEQGITGTPKFHGWRESAICESWDKFGPWELDELNEVVNFYFEVSRDSTECTSCGGSGLNPETDKISEAFYGSGGGRRWDGSITQDEVEALVKSNRLMDLTHKWTTKDGYKKIDPPVIPTATEVNQWNKNGMGHDAINRFILIEARATRLGVYGKCVECTGSGSTYTANHAEVGLVLWVLHPRKGCSRGVHVKNIQQTDLPKVIAYLKEAAQRNADRFKPVMGL